MAGDASDLRFPLCVSAQTVARDLDAILRFKPISGIRAQVGGFMFRAQSANDCVVAPIPLDNSVRLYRMDKGKRSQIAAKEAPVGVGQWHSLRVIASNESFEVWLDGKTLFTATDRTLPQAGAMGVWSQADSITHYGSLLVSAAR